MMEYVLAMATGDAEPRPKGGWKEYEMGEHVKPGLHGRKRGELLGNKSKSRGPTFKSRGPTSPPRPSAKQTLPHGPG